MIPFNEFFVTSNSISDTAIALFGWWSLCMMLTSFHVLRPIAYVLVGIEDKVRRTRHVMLAFTLAHVVVGAVQFVRMIADMAILLVASDLVSCIWKEFDCNL